jgi:hypothetical protein
MSNHTRWTIGATVALVSLCMMERSGRSQQPEVKKACSIVGVWTQYYEHEKTERSAHGTFRVALKDGKVQMTIEDQTKAPEDSINTKGLFNVKTDGATWEFHSDWGDDRTAVFKLKRVNDDVYEGYSYLDNQKVNHNIWIRTKK